MAATKETKPTIVTDGDVLTLEAAAAFFGKTVGTLRAWRRKRGFPIREPGIVLGGDLRQWIENQEVQPNIVGECAANRVPRKRRRKAGK